MATNDEMDLDELMCPDEDDNWDDWEDESPRQIVCFFCDKSYSDAKTILQHCYNDHKFDIRLYCSDLDQLTYIRLVNFIRATKPKCDEMDVMHGHWLKDEFLQPVDPEDPMLLFDVEDFDLLELPAMSSQQSGDCKLSSDLLNAELRLSEAENKIAVLLTDLEHMREVAQAFMLNGPPKPTQTPLSSSIQALTKEEDAGYVQPYGHYSIHQEMLQDKVRTSSYGDFILQNPHIFKDKIVLDIGCGTGILSLFAAKAGAKRVFAVDHSDIYIQAKDIVNENGYEDVISVIHGKVEELELPVDEVDIIISEWMGYFLLFESMLDTIIFAREKWLSADGAVYPDLFTISLVGCGDSALYDRNVEYWNDVYGFKMNCMRDLVVREAAVEVIKNDQIITEPSVVKHVNACDISMSDVDFTSEFQLKVTKAGSISAIVGYFDTIFSKNAEKTVEFSTGPHAETTHWKQTIFLVDPPLEVKESDLIDGSIICRKNPRDPRSLKVCLTLNGKMRKYVVE